MNTPAIATLIDGTEIKGELTTDHAASSYGQPVFVVGGEAYDWIQIASISTAATAADAGRSLGQSTSERKAAASRANGRKGGRPRKSTRPESE